MILTVNGTSTQAQAGSMANQRLREALAGVPSTKEKGTPVSDGILTVTPDSPEAAEWRNKSVLDCVATTSTYLEDDTDGRKPSELFGKFTWKIDNFSEISKRELRSSQFDVGEYKWYILVYPQGCDVCNHLSLFLCVADYDKLLPGWSHFAQFTIAVVNKDPKKSKYSDTLHRFCKKEHDWGWKKFMELSKVLDGFTVSDTLVIKAQVQVILDKPARPFRCLDPQYRRELVRVYLTNVESICRRFCDDKRAKLAWLKEEEEGFAAWWRSLGRQQQRELVSDRGDTILKGLVKQFFNEKEVTSTLVMDALYSGCRQLEEAGRFLEQGKPVEGEGRVLVQAARNLFYFGLDALELQARAMAEYIPPSRDHGDKASGGLVGGADGVGLRSGGEGDTEVRRDGVERDEKRLAELGRRTVEMYALAHMFTERLEAQYRHAQALKRMEALIAEEEEQGRLNDERTQARLAADKEKRAKKKERKKAKKEADKAKKEAEEEERRAADEARLRAEAVRAAEASERRRQEEAAEQALMQQQEAVKRQRLQDKAARRQQAAADPAVLAAKAAAASAAAAPAAHAVDEAAASGSGREERLALPQAPYPVPNGIASTSSSSSMPIKGAGGHSSQWLDHRGRASGSSSPATHSLADSQEPAAPRSLADSSHDADTSDTCSIDSSKAVGPVAGSSHHHHHHMQQQQAAGAMNGPSSRSEANTPSANGHMQGAHAAASGAAPGPSSQQQQEQQAAAAAPILPAYIPLGYAAAVAHRPAPGSAAPMDPSRRTREQALEEEVGALRKRVRMLENTLAERGQQLAERVTEVSNLRAQVSEVQVAAHEEVAAAREGQEHLAALQKQHAALQQQHAALQQRHQQLQQDHSALQQRLQHQQQQEGGWQSAETPTGSSGGAWQTAAAAGGGDGRPSTSSASSDGGAADAVTTPTARPAPWAAVTAGTAVSYSAAAAGPKGDVGAGGSGSSLKAAAAGGRVSEDAGPSASGVGMRRTASSGGGGSSYADSLTGGSRSSQQQQQQAAAAGVASSSAGADDKGSPAEAPATPFSRSGGAAAAAAAAGSAGQQRLQSSGGDASTASSSKPSEPPPADKAPGGSLAAATTPRYSSISSTGSLDAAGTTAAGPSERSSRGGSAGGGGGRRPGLIRTSSLGAGGAPAGSSGGGGGPDVRASTPTAASQGVSRASSDPGEVVAAPSSSSAGAAAAAAGAGAAGGSNGPGSGRVSLEEPVRPSSSSTGSDSGGLAGVGSYMSSMTGVLSAGVAGQGGMGAFGGSGLAGNLQGEGVGSSSSGGGAGLGPLSGGLGLGGMQKHLGDPPSTLRSMAGRSMAADHGYAAFGRSGMGFGSMAAATAAANKATSPGAGNRSSASSIGNIDDSNLDGFVHMNMIDDLLTE